jgi:hypothetical protein
MDANLGIAASGGTAVLVLYLVGTYCYRKQIHTKIISGCCKVEVDVESSPKNKDSPV